MIDLSHGAVRRRPHAPAAARPPADGRGVPLAVVRGPARRSRPQVAELVPYRWAIRQLADELGCAADERSVVAATRGLDQRRPGSRPCASARRRPASWSTPAIPPPDESLPLEQIRATGVDVAPLLRLEAVAGDLIAEGLAVRRPDRALRRRRERRARRRLRGAQEHRGLPQRPRDPPLGGRATPRRRSSASARHGVTRVQEQALVDFLLLRALPVARRDDLPVQLHAGYGDRDLDLRLVNPLHLRGMLSSDEAQGVHFVVLHAAWPYVREGAFLTAVYANVTLDIATCIPPLGHAALLEAWRCALAVGAINRLHASTDAAGPARAHRARRGARPLDARPGARRARRDRRAVGRPGRALRRGDPLGQLAAALLRRVLTSSSPTSVQAGTPGV